MTSTQWNSVRSALEKLRESGASDRVFGAHKHKFVTNPALSEREVSAFEQLHGILLPPDYRSFLMEVGNGGAGPAYGVFKLGEMDDGHDEGPWNDLFIGTLAKPFPHTSAWNDPSGMPIFDEAWENTPREEEYELEYQAWEDRYWRTENVNGAIPICHLGCARRQWLVITGPERGNVWDDYRTDHEGLEPLQIGGRDRVTFVEWYLAWLDEAQLRRETR